MYPYATFHVLYYFSKVLLRNLYIAFPCARQIVEIRPITR